MVVGAAQWGTCTRTVFYAIGIATLACWNNNIAATSFTGRDIIILDALTGSQTAVLSGHTGKINSLTYSSDGTFLVSGGWDKTIKLWDVQTGGVVKTLCGHTNKVDSVSISADDTMIASASSDKTICLWNIKTGNCCIIERYIDRARTVTFFPTNSQLLFSSSDGAVQQWDINGHKIGFPVPGDNVVFSPDGTQFVSWNGKTVTIRNTGSRITVVEFNMDKGPMYCCFSPNGRFIAAATGYAIHIWNITGPDPYLTQTLTGHSDSVARLAFSSPYSLISASFDESIKFWQIDAPPADPVLSDSKSSSLTPAQINSVSLQARDGLAFSIDSAGLVKTWNISTGSCKESYKLKVKRIMYADIQLISGRLIIVWSEVDENKIKVWDAKKGKLKTIGKLGDIQGLRMIGDGSRVLLLYKDSIQAWDIWTGKCVCEEKLREGYRGFDSLRMDGTKVLLFDFGSFSAQGWDFGTPGSTPTQLPETFSGRPHLNFTDVGEQSELNRARVEDSVTGREVFRLRGRYANPRATQWDGQYLITGYLSGEVLILDFRNALS